MSFYTPTGKCSEYCYQYCYTNEKNKRVIRFDIVKITNRDHIYTVIHGNGVNKKNPSVEVLDMCTNDRLRVNVQDLNLICRVSDDSRVACSCREHNRLSKAYFSGVYKSNISLPPEPKPLNEGSGATTATVIAPAASTACGAVAVSGDELGDLVIELRKLAVQDHAIINVVRNAISKHQSDKQLAIELEDIQAADEKEKEEEKQEPQEVRAVKKEADSIEKR